MGVALSFLENLSNSALGSELRWARWQYFGPFLPQRVRISRRAFQAPSPEAMRCVCGMFAVAERPCQPAGSTTPSITTARTRSG